MDNTIIGKQFGKLKVLSTKREDKRTYCYCLCECKNEVWVRRDALTSENTKSCGCMKEENYFKSKDMKGRTFDRLKALEPTNQRDKNNGSVIWKCQCECGNITYVSVKNLSEKTVRSCGCLGKENSKSNIAKAIKVHLEKHITKGTNLQMITRNTPISTNKSGVTGVYWSKSRQRWVAQIEFQGRHYNLGRFTDKEEAIKVRKEAEKKYFGKVLDELI